VDLFLNIISALVQCRPCPTPCKAGMKEDPILPTYTPTFNDTTTYPPTMPPTTPATEAPRTARGIARMTVHIPSAFRKAVGKTGSAERKPSPPRWNTLEFRFYYLFAMVALPVIAWVPISVSQREQRHLSSKCSVFI
jgi:hypothetical protein